MTKFLFYIVSSIKQDVEELKVVLKVKTQYKAMTINKFKVITLIIYNIPICKLSI